MRPKKLFYNLILGIFIFGHGHSLAQDSIDYKLRKTLVIGGNAVAYPSSMTGLYFLWYKDYDLVRFHWFNDNQQWLQMDKFGHAFSCYYEGLVGYKMMKWAGYSQKEAALIGGSYGFLIQSGVELFDGFSEAWGASSGDVLANLGGTAMVIGQELIWEEQRIMLKYSFWPSEYSVLRPNVLGSNFPEKVLKDYNAQTYWLSTNIHAFFPDSKWPAWLNVAVGYGADGMIGGRENIFESDGVVYDYSNLPRCRQFYLSPDIDLTKLKVKSQVLKASLVVLNCFKFPLPTLEYHTQEGFKPFFIYF